MGISEIICPYCRRRLRLFQSQIKQKKGTVRCIGCGARIPYDLAHPGRIRGFGPGRPVPFRQEHRMVRFDRSGFENYKK